MVTSLLRTKLCVPPIRAELVPRPRLIGRLIEGLDRRLTLVSAPAGFGKTTLLTQCIAECERIEPKLRFAWLSVDRRDNDPARFWRYVVAALQTVCPKLGESATATLHAFHPSSVEDALVALLNEIAATSTERLALVLDDFHLIAETQIHDGLAFLLDNLPPPPGGLHLIVSSRADLPWPIARLRVRGELIELRPADLRFSSEEVAAFLNGVEGLELSPESVATLDARTEGWIAGLQLAAISLREHQRSRGLQGVSSSIRTFAASHRFVLDYLVEEVLDQQPPDIHEFLLHTSVLDQMTASLCDAVTGGSESQTMLEQIERANLFLLPLDGERRWYRYHHLFADLLRRRLERLRPDQGTVLHRRASQWFERNGLTAAAIGHSLSAGDVDRVARLARRDALAVMDYDELGSVASWLGTLHEDVLGTRPWLSVASAWAHFYVGQFDVVHSRLRAIEAGLQAADDARDLAGHVAAIRCYVAAARGEMSRAQMAASVALGLLPERDQAMRGFVSALHSAALRWTGDLVAAAQASAQSVSISRASGDEHALIAALAIRATLLHTRGQLRQASAVGREALELADDCARRQGKQPPVAASAHRLLSRIHYEWNDLGQAERHVRQAIKTSEEWGGAEDLAFAFLVLAKVRQVTGDAQGALDAIHRGRQKAYTLSPWLGSHAASHQARLWLTQGNLAEAKRWAEGSGLGPEDGPEFQYAHEYSVLARVLAADGALEPALVLLGRLRATAEAAGAGLLLIETLILRALALAKQGKSEQALSSLTRALNLAEPEGLVRTFIDEGAPVGILLREAARQGIATQYATTLTAALDQETAPPAAQPKRAAHAPRAPSRGRSGHQPLVETLTDRERQILRLLGTHMTTRDIAAELVVSWHTVRTHIKHIYGKLGASSRSEAVERAHNLGLI